MILVIIQLSQKISHWCKQIVIGKLKDETSGAAIEEFVGLMGKMY